MTAPVDRRRKRRRSRRYSCPRRRAAWTGGLLPTRSSCSSRASNTQIVVLKDDRVEPLMASQFQPPSGSCSGSSRSTMPRTSWPKYAPTAPTCPLIQGSTSPAKKGLPSHSRGPQPFQVTPSRTSPTALRALSLAGSSPMSRSSIRTCIVEFHPRFQATPPHRPSAHWRASSWAPAPSVATRARSAATSSVGASVRSRITCQRIEGSESSSHRMTDLLGFGTCRLGGLGAICWSYLFWSKDIAGGLTALIIVRFLFCRSSTALLLKPASSLLLMFYHLFKRGICYLTPILWRLLIET